MTVQISNSVEKDFLSTFYIPLPGYSVSYHIDNVVLHCEPGFKENILVFGKYDLVLCYPSKLNDLEPGYNAVTITRTFCEPVLFTNPDAPEMPSGIIDIQAAFGQPLQVQIRLGKPSDLKLWSLLKNLFSRKTWVEVVVEGRIIAEITNGHRNTDLEFEEYQPQTRDCAIVSPDDTAIQRQEAVIDLEALAEQVQKIISRHEEERASGVDGKISEIEQKIISLIQEAKAAIDPEALAERLFDWEMRTHFDTFYAAAGTYSELLGKSGLAAYRRRAEDAWARVPQTRHGEKDPEEYGRTYRIKHIMETLARQSGDVEALVAIKARDLSNAYTFLQIAEIYREAKQADKALEWAERGVKAFSDRTDSRLCEFLADEYHRRKRHDEAMQIIWKIFTERTSLETYQTLKKHADRIDQWTAWRGKALEFIRTDIDGEKKRLTQKRQPWGWTPQPPDHSLLVQIFLWEKDGQAAWHEAQAGGCHGGLWMELARLREKQFPDDVVPIYQKQVDTLINQKNNGSYAEAVKLLGKIRDLMTRLKQADQFAAYLVNVRATHKPKRNFIKLAARL